MQQLIVILADTAHLKKGVSMSSLYDDLSEKLKKDPRLMKRGGPRVDISLLLFNARDSIRELWDAADREIAEAGSECHHSSELLKAAVDKLRPIFGERSKQ
jgi:hypothetical protein